MSLGAGKGPRRNHDGGLTTEWVLWFLFGSLASEPALEGSGLFPDGLVSEHGLTLSQGPSYTMRLD